MVFLSQQICKLILSQYLLVKGCQCFLTRIKNMQGSYLGFSGRSSILLHVALENRNVDQKINWSAWDNFFGLSPSSISAFWGEAASGALPSASYTNLCQEFHPAGAAGVKGWLMNSHRQVHGVIPKLTPLPSQVHIFFILSRLTLANNWKLWFFKYHKQHYPQFNSSCVLKSILSVNTKLEATF